MQSLLTQRLDPGEFIHKARNDSFSSRHEKHSCYECFESTRAHQQRSPFSSCVGSHVATPLLILRPTRWSKMCNWRAQKKVQDGETRPISRGWRSPTPFRKTPCLKNTVPRTVAHLGCSLRRTRSRRETSLVPRTKGRDYLVFHFPPIAACQSPINQHSVLIGHDDDNWL